MLYQHVYAVSGFNNIHPLHNPYLFIRTVIISLQLIMLIQRDRILTINHHNWNHGHPEECWTPYTLHRTAQHDNLSLPQFHSQMTLCTNTYTQNAIPLTLYYINRSLSCCIIKNDNSTKNKH